LIPPLGPALTRKIRAAQENLGAKN
jgi:hypothetical protein